MSDELKNCPHCGNNDYVKAVRVEGENVSPDNFQVVCCWLSGGCGASGGVRRTEDEAIAAWNQRADKFGADDDYERRMDELLCRLTNGKWSKSRSYSVDFMVSCVDEAYDEILDPPVERHYAPRNTRADDAPELPQDDACAILRRVAADKTDTSSDDLLRYAVGADMVPEALNKIADMIERDYVRRDSIADDAPEQPVDNQADSRERLEADIKKYRWKHGETSGRVAEWLDRQGAITRRECYDSEGWRIGLTREAVHDGAPVKIFGVKYVPQAAVDSLTAERDRLKRRLERQDTYIANVEDELCRYESQLVRNSRDFDKLTAERDELRDKAHMLADSWNEITSEYNELKKKCEFFIHDRDVWAEECDRVNALLAEKQHVCDVQRDSFLKLEAENAELRKELDECSR